MKLPLIAVVLGMLLGIVLTIFVAPETPQGVALIIFVAILCFAVVVLGIDRLWPKRQDPPPPPPPGGIHD
nr:hypothetical protein [Polymorphobacter sp.]